VVKTLQQTAEKKMKKKQNVVKTKVQILKLQRELGVNAKTKKKK
jgi:hypothetical protein